ncbi:hypothetical protein RJ639_036597 [Escallonia herrerae]|uniref:Apple domain-containing protein n=1 Tax=Escallonia herrerae TaxID=1293975 RepID=A0AA88WRN4_9ASTE|nr:hypothetical protein RJ639_036597 [Escallonia herrerae]
MLCLSRDQCDDYVNCGPNSICDTSDPRVCSCVTGYVPKSSQDWDMLLWYENTDLLQFWMKASMSLEECRLECLKNCTCTAYASASGAGSGCLLWFGDLIDIRNLKEYGNQKLYIRAAATGQGAINHLTWNERRNEWIVIITLRADVCDGYAFCGPYGFCNVDRPLLCQCPDGFTPRLPEDWARLDWSGGCVRKTPLNCSVATGFRRFPRLKLPDMAYFLVNRTEMNLVECREACLRNCSCVAYARTEVSGCVAWLGGLVDVRGYSEGGQDLYIKMAASDLAGTFGQRHLLEGEEAWRVWNEGKPLELVDALMESPAPTAEILKCIQTGLLCVQQRPEDRPTMSLVLLALDSENPMLPQPKQPGFYTERFLPDTDSSSTGKKHCSSSNDLTVTMLQGR